ncbi:hypothetical protein T4B_11965, partial [Trichinella pseudospiralis]
LYCICNLMNMIKNSVDQENTVSTISNSNRVVMRLINAVGMLFRKFKKILQMNEQSILVKSNYSF